MCVCICRPVAAAACHLWLPQALCGSKQSLYGSQELGLWSGGRGLSPERIAVLSKLLLTPAKEMTNYFIVPFFVPSFYCTLQVWAWAPLFSRPGVSSRTATFVTQSRLTPQTLLWLCIELFSSRMFFSVAAMINKLGSNHLSISRQKILHALIHIISAKLRKRTETFRMMMEEQRASSFPSHMGSKPTASSAFIISLIQFQAQSQIFSP